MYTYPQTHTDPCMHTHNSSDLGQLNWSSDLKVTSIRHFSVFTEMHFTRVCRKLEVNSQEKNE